MPPRARKPEPGDTIGALAPSRVTLAVGLVAVAFSAVYLASDVIEVARGGLRPRGPVR